MRKKLFFRSLGSIWLMTLMFIFVGCADEELNISPLNNSDIITTHNCNWTTATVNDTIYLSCEQTVSYTINDDTRTLHPNAYVKLWLKKDSITFGSTDDVIPILRNTSQTDGSFGTSPKRNIITKEFTFQDGQTAIAEIMYESYTITHQGTNSTLPHTLITDIEFNKASGSQTNSADDKYLVSLMFNVSWKVSNETTDNTESISQTYIKTRENQPDNLLKTEYQKGYNWIDENSVSFYVEKIETWSISGQKSQKYQSDMLDFSVIGYQNRSIEASNLDFSASQSTLKSEPTQVGSSPWNIQKTTITKTISFTNNLESFDDVFEYPAYIVSLAIDNQTFEYDIPIDAKISYHLTGSGTTAQNVTTATVTVLNKTFTSNITTSISKKETEDEPETQPETSTVAYGKIINYSVTAVFDPSAINTNGEITKKCITIRFEEGYLWGICEYEEALPETFNYTVSGYTGFNSAAMDNTTSPYEIARAKDINGGIAWYAENNKVIAGIDDLTCMAYGWKNIVNGKYSAFVEGYSAAYSSDKYTITITAPNGQSIKFVSSKPNN